MNDGSYNWQDDKEIDRFIADWTQGAKFLEFTGEPDPIEELRMRLKRGDFGGANKRAIAVYLKRHDARVLKVSALGQADRDERAVRAAERSARWAGWAIFVSLAALALAGWPYIKTSLV